MARFFACDSHALNLMLGALVTNKFIHKYISYT